MSSICGFFNINGESASKEIGVAMMEKLSIYHADFSEEFYEENFFFGCLLQVITPESELEKLPYHDYNTGLTVTADAIIDNRLELMDIFSIASSDRSRITDSQLILMAFKKWGEKCPAYLIGDYAFAIFDKYKNELFCARDHVGKRTFYYSISSNTFAFSTLMKPLFVIPGVGQRLNDLWIADFLAISAVAHEIDSNHTVYQDIQQLLPAHTITINRDGIRKVKYWDPLSLPTISFKNSAEYDDAFREVFFEAVHCRTRSIGSVGVLLSGGLDSGAVACVAAKKLNEIGKDLKAFSALPMDGYKEWLPSNFIADESPYIEAIKNYYPNIKVTYCRSEGKHSYTDVGKYLDILEQPYKTVENMFWMDSINNLAVNNNCKVLLDGQFGNSTISYGDFYVQAFSLFKQFKLIALLNEIKDYCKIHRMSRKKFGKYLAIKFLPAFLHMDSLNNKSEIKEFTLISSALSSKYDTNRRVKKAGYNLNTKRINTLSQMRRLTMESTAFTHIGAMETKMSLAYGIVKRDPTRDKRVIDFCFRIPGDQYVKHGQERHLIRRSMEGVLPDKVRLNTSVRGLQSADWLQRITPVWDELQQAILNSVEKKNILPYINTAEVIQAINMNRVLVDNDTNTVDIRKLLVCLIFGDFLESIS